MTTVISRLYPNKKAAGAVVAALQSAGFPNNTLEIISSKVEDLPNRLASARLPKTAAATYADELTGDMSLMVVRAPFTPFGAARKAIEIVDSFEALPSAVTNNNVLVQDQLSDDLSLSILRDHPRFLTSDAETRRERGPVTPMFGMKLLSSRNPRTSAMSGGSFMSKMFWPMPLLSKRKDKLSVYRGGKKFLTS